MTKLYEDNLLKIDPSRRASKMFLSIPATDFYQTRKKDEKHNYEIDFPYTYSAVKINKNLQIGK